MKKLYLLILLISILFTTHAQNYQMDVEIFQAAEMSFAPFLFSNDLTGAPRIFAVTISPEQGNVKVRGEVYWQQDVNSGFEWLLTFRTKVFQARTFFNTDLGTSIELENTQSNGDLVEENRSIGKPSGKYQLIIYLLDEAGNILTDNNNQEIVRTREYEFSNPAQTLEIISPMQGSVQNVGSVLAEWTSINGVDHYEISAAVVDEASQSLEDALNSFPLLIDDINVGTVTSTDLRLLLSREWLPGQQVAFQVSAIPQGGSSAGAKESNIVSFYIDNPSSPIEDGTSEELQNLIQSFSDGVGSDLLERLLNGSIIITDINWETTGLSLTQEEIENLLLYLRQNPDNLISIEQD